MFAWVTRASDAPGEHARSGNTPVRQPLDFVRVSSTTATDAGDAGVAFSASHTATPRWCEHVPERVVEKLYVPSLQRAVAPGGAAESAAAGASSAAKAHTATILGTRPIDTCQRLPALLTDRV